MSSDVVMKLSNLDYNIISNPEINDFPDDLIPTAITDDGIIIEVLPNDENLMDGFLIAYGKLLALQKYIQINNKERKYSVLLLLSTYEFKNLHPELRKAAYTNIPIIVV